VNRIPVAAAALLALAACAHAPPATVAGDVCIADAARLCPGVEPGAGRVLACLRGRAGELSMPCKVAVEPPQTAQAELDKACRPAGEKLCPGLSPSATFECLRWRYAELPQACQDAMWVAQEKYDQFKALCARDMDRWCKGVESGEGRIIACLRPHAADLAPLCREMVAP
jgi:hypothetical protein